MNPQHYSLLKDLPGFYEKPWIVVGTGPSMQLLKNFDQYNIWAINHAGDYCQNVFVWSVTDWISLTETGAYKILLGQKQCRALLTRAKNHPKILSIFSFSDYLCSIAKQPLFSEKFWPLLYWIQYDHDYDRDSDILPLFPGLPFTPGSCSSSLAVMLLGEFGIKKIYTAGIDGGIAVRDPMFDGLRSTQNALVSSYDYSKHNEGMYAWSKILGIEIIPLSSLPT